VATLVCSLRQGDNEDRQPKLALQRSRTSGVQPQIPLTRFKDLEYADIEALVTLCPASAVVGWPAPHLR
jgi:hypothetical protein